MKDELTQEDFDKAFVECKTQWDKLVAASGQTDQMYAILGGEEAHSFLYYNQQAKEHAETLGLHWPELVKGVTVTEQSE